MPISRLPEATARELGSTLAVSSPVAVVKELLDNALDAGASFVDLIVSLDTLDRIEVRDNGHGISADDLDALGRSGYTSKIATFDDVIALGGKSLGFRGVALASINAVSEITFITRTAADTVATLFTLSPGGGIARKQHIAAPVGTSIHVTKLFSRTPVREIVAQRDARKNIINMKDLLQAYALARPHVKLHFRVVSGDHTLPWSYSPKPQGGGIREAVVQLFGTELASSCAERTFCVSPTDAAREGNLAFEAYLPHSFADTIRITKQPFFSVDSRPVLAKRGTLRKLYDIFKMHLSRSMSYTGQTDSLRSPFIRLNIRCEPRSYDVNVEPSKDDVLFHNESYLINQFEEFMLSVYPAIPKSPATRGAPTVLTPSCIEPQQSKNYPATSQFYVNSQGPHVTSPAIASDTGAASVCSPSPDAGKRLEIGNRGRSSYPTVQASATAIPIQPSLAPINSANIRESLKLGAYPAPPSFSQNYVGENGPSNIALAARQSGPGRAGSIRPASFIDDLARTRLAYPGGRDNLDPTGYFRTDGNENSREFESGGIRPGSLAAPLQPNRGLDRILPTPSMQPGGVQIRPNIQTQPVLADISACFTDSDDEDPISRRPPQRPGPHPIGRDGFRGTGDDGETGNNPLQGLNPWSIAKLTVPRRRYGQRGSQAAVEERVTESVGELAGRPLSAARVPPRPQQKHTTNFTGPPRQPPFKVPGGAYKKPTMGEPRSTTRPEPMVQTTLSRFRAPGHPGYAHTGIEQNPRDPMAQAPIVQNTGPRFESSRAPLPKEDPRSYLFDDQQPVANGTHRRLRRCETDLLPLEKTPLGSETHQFRRTLNVSTQNLAAMVQRVSGLDRYYIDGKVECGLSDNITPDDILGLVARAKALLTD